MTPGLQKRLEKGSWISPQILSVLSIFDDEFEAKGKEILENGFQVKYSPTKMAEHHSARGPEGSKGASEKVMTSLKSLLNNREDEIRWRINLIKLIEDKRFKSNTRYR